MPCSTCNNLFVIKPCTHPTGELYYKTPFKREIDSEVLIVNITESMLSSITKQRLRNLYKLLHDQCPCVECLVKSICSMKSPDCETYYSLITQANV